jgi:hypothetical protein
MIIYYKYVSIIKINNFKFSICSFKFSYRVIPDTKFEIVNFYYWNVLIINNHLIIWLFQKTISSCQVSLAWPGLQVELEATLLIKYIKYFTICLCYLKLTVYSNFKFSLVPSTIWINVVFMMSRIDSWHRKISTRLHFQNGHHNTTKIQHCSISKVAFDLFTDIGKIFSMSGINSGHHYLPTYQILMISDNVEFLPLIFYAVFWQPFWKW